MSGDRKAQRQSESHILNACLIALSAAGVMAFRNNTGTLPNREGRPIRFGLCVGSSDIIAIAPDGVFVAVECKTAIDQPTDAQVRFLEAVRAHGGRSGIARSGNEAVAIALGQPRP